MSENFCRAQTVFETFKCCLVTVHYCLCNEYIFNFLETKIAVCSFTTGLWEWELRDGFCLSATTHSSIILRAIWKLLPGHRSFCYSKTSGPPKHHPPIDTSKRLDKVWKTCWLMASFQNCLFIEVIYKF